MEPKDEPKKESEKEISEEKTVPKKETLNNIRVNDSKNNKAKKNIQYNKLELDKQHFQIIQQKKSENNINSKDIEKEHRALSDKNIVNFKNKGDKDNIQTQFKELKETGKKSHSEDKNEINYNAYKFNDNNQNVYSLLNSYYKDIDLNFKDKKTTDKKKGKNFLLKNSIHEKNNNQNTEQTNYQYNYPFIPQFYYPNIYFNNNQNIYPDYMQNPLFSKPENSLNINNQINYHLSNNINNYNYNYNYNFQKNKYKYKQKFTNENHNEHELYIINVEKIIKGIEKRTTVMIRHIPNRYNYQNLVEEINIVCKDKYDFLYLPIDPGNNCNLGYAFINFINPLHIVYFYDTFKSRKWLYFNSFKECDLTFAKYQGKSELTSNFEKNIYKSDDKRRIPLIFEIKNPPKIDLPKKYHEMIKEYKVNFLKDINWI